MGQIQQPLLMLQSMVNINWSCAVVIFFWMKCVDRYFCNWLYSYTFIGVLGRGHLFIYFWFIGWRISVTLSVLLAACTEVWWSDSERFWRHRNIEIFWNHLLLECLPVKSGRVCSSAQLHQFVPGRCVEQADEGSFTGGWSCHAAGLVECHTGNLALMGVDSKRGRWCSRFGVGQVLNKKQHVRLQLLRRRHFLQEKQNVLFVCDLQPAAGCHICDLGRPEAVSPNWDTNHKDLKERIHCIQNTKQDIAMEKQLYTSSMIPLGLSLVSNSKSLTGLSGKLYT